MRILRPSVRLVLLAACLLLAAGCHIKAPPVVEQVTSSLRVRTGDTASVAAYAIGFESDSVSLRFSWGDGRTSAWSHFVASRDTVSMGHSWSEPAHVLVKTQARDRRGNVSDWFGGVRVVVLDSSVVKWVLPLGFEGVRQCPAVGPDGTIYVSGYSSLSAVSPEGVLRWRYDELYFPGSPVIGPDGTVYINGGTYDCVRALRPDGSLKWADTADRSTQHSPAVDVDGTVYFGTYDSAVALNPDGSVKWRAALPGCAIASPVITTDHKILFPTSGGQVCALHTDGSTVFTAVQLGDIRWVTAGPDRFFYVVAGRTLIAVGPYGARQWTRLLPGNVTHSPAICGDGNIIVPFDSGFGRPPGLEVVTPAGEFGNAHWFDVGVSPAAPAIDAEGNIVIGVDSWHEGFSEFSFLDAALHARWSFDAGEAAASPATIVQDGTVYVGAGSWDGYLYALKGTSGPAASPWSKFQHDERNSGCAATGR
jgi:hypothetical protein